MKLPASSSSRAERMTSSIHCRGLSVSLFLKHRGKFRRRRSLLSVFKISFAAIQNTFEQLINDKLFYIDN
jgi:hypothetical protein